MGIGVAAVRSIAATAAVLLIHWGGRWWWWWVLWFVVLRGARSRNGESAAGKKDSHSEKVGELHLGWVDGLELRKEESEFDVKDERLWNTELACCE